MNIKLESTFSIFLDSWKVINFWIEVLTTVVMKSSVLWDITPCSPLKVKRCFGGTFCFHLQGQRINQQETSLKQVAGLICGFLPASRWFLASLLRHVPPKLRLNFSGLRGVVTQKMEHFISFFCAFPCLSDTHFNFITLSHELYYEYMAVIRAGRKCRYVINLYPCIFRKFRDWGSIYGVVSR
jgi:hypothetical protein